MLYFYFTEYLKIKWVSVKARRIRLEFQLKAIITNQAALQTKSLNKKHIKQLMIINKITDKKVNATTLTNKTVTKPALKQKSKTKKIKDLKVLLFTSLY